MIDEIALDESIRCIKCHVEMILIHLGTISFELKNLGEPYHKEFKIACEAHKTIVALHKTVTKFASPDQTINT